jgi:transposase-like protein
MSHSMNCPNPDCKCHTTPYTNFYIKKGYYKSKHNHQPVPRYKCKCCGKYFSSASFKDTFKQHKPELNEQIFELYSSNVTLTRIASILKCNRKTVVRKFMFMAAKLHLIHKDRIDNGELKTSYVQFDEMESFEVTRQIPVSIAIAVRPKTGEIIDAAVATMNTKGKLAKESVAKYGYRLDTRKDVLTSILNTVDKCKKVHDKTKRFTIASDAKRAYITLVNSIIPTALHLKYASRINSDELFVLNHVCARIRHDMSRMNRKSWVTTKKIDRLQGHLDAYIGYKNGYFKQVKGNREYSLQEIKQVCFERYLYSPVDYAQRFRLFVKTLPVQIQLKVKELGIRGIKRFRMAMYDGTLTPVTP